MTPLSDHARRTDAQTNPPDSVALSIVLPCFNEEAVLMATYERVKRVCLATELRHEILFVNDGSSDGTWELLRSLAGRDSSVVAVNLSRNHGHQRALSAGLATCRGARAQATPSQSGSFVPRTTDCSASLPSVRFRSTLATSA
ncbi:MAG: glycosyltransferase [Planctomycetes bacterium]|nr:glycosyltransferase [Planctomycetota bacterium]